MSSCCESALFFFPDVSLGGFAPLGRVLRRSKRRQGGGRTSRGMLAGGFGLRLYSTMSNYSFGVEVRFREECE